MLSATVTNSGARGDTFVLDAGGFFATSACFTTALPCQTNHALSLAPGASEVVDVVISGLTVFLQQSTLLTIQVTSQTTPDIVSADFALLEVGTFRSVTLSAEPAAMTQTALEVLVEEGKSSTSGIAMEKKP